MVSCAGHRTSRPAALAAAVLALASPAVEAQAPSPAGPGTPNPWNTGTAPPAPRPPAADSTLSLRLYEEGLARGQLPYRPGPPRRDDPAWAVDVSAVMTRCPDGNLVITALVIGGQLTPLDNRCRDEGQRDTPAAPGTTPSPASPQCDAKSWNCNTKPAD